MTFFIALEGWLNQHCHHYTIRNPGANGSLVDYMTRYHLVRIGGFRLALHHMVQSDGDRELHGHPWMFWSLPLKNGYLEHRLSGVYRRRPGQVLILGRAKLHRIELLEGKDSWSLVLMFPRLNHSWCFLVGRRLCPWISFLRAKGVPLGHI